MKMQNIRNFISTYGFFSSWALGATSFTGALTYSNYKQGLEKRRIQIACEPTMISPLGLPTDSDSSEQPSATKTLKLR